MRVLVCARSLNLAQQPSSGRRVISVILRWVEAILAAHLMEFLYQGE
jgi:hypothetical protein